MIRCHSKPPHSQRDGFTLIELLCVVTIIIILVGMIVGTSSYMNRKALEAAITSEIKAMEVAIENYKADNGVYPGAWTDTNYDGTTWFNKAPAFTPVPPDSNPWFNSCKLAEALWPTNGTKIYLNLKPNQVKVYMNSGVTNYHILDPLGTPYAYMPVGIANPSTFDIWSVGFDGKSQHPKFSQTNDDIGNWRR